MQKIHQTKLHDQIFEYFSWEVLGEGMFELAQQILKTAPEFDRVIALAKGGLTLARSLNDFLNIPELSSISVEFYTDVEKTAKMPVITQSLPVSIRDERILVFDDVVDSGETLRVAVEYLKHHGMKAMQTAAFVYKPRSVIKPTFFAHETSSWVIFPNESREHIQLLTKSWQAKGDSPEQIRQHLMEIGLPKAEVEFFSSLK